MGLLPRRRRVSIALLEGEVSFLMGSAPWKAKTRDVPRTGRSARKKASLASVETRPFLVVEPQEQKTTRSAEQMALQAHVILMRPELLVFHDSESALAETKSDDASARSPPASKDIPQHIRGITLEHFKALLEYYVQPKQAQLKRKLITREVVKLFVEPMTARKQCQFSSILCDVPEFEGLKHPEEGCQVDYFITHTWDHVFEDLVHALASSFKDEDSFWFCALCINQHKLATELGDKGVFTHALLHPLTKGHIVMVDEGLGIMKRMWVVFEIMTNLQASSGKTTCKPKPVHILPKAIFDDIGSVSSLRIDLNEAKCFDKADEEYILARLQQVSGQEDTINKQIRCVMALAAIEHMMLSQLAAARILQRFGQQELAMTVYENTMDMSMNAQFKQLGDLDPSMFVGFRQTSLLLAAAYCGLLYRKENWKQIFDKTKGLAVQSGLVFQHYGDLSLLNVLALTLTEVGACYEAVEIMREVLKCTQGTVNEWQVHNNLGFILHYQGRLHEAREHYATSWKTTPTKMDSRHPDKLVARFNEASCIVDMVEQGEYGSETSKAFEMLQEALEKCREVESGWAVALGADHKSVKKVQRNMKVLTTIMAKLEPGPLPKP